MLLCDINEEKLKKAAIQLEGKGAKVFSKPVNVTNEAQVESFINAGCKHFGEINVWINNAGIYPQKALIEMSSSEWDQLFNVNLKSVFLCIKAVSKPMKNQNSGVIINAASFAGIIPPAESFVFKMPSYRGKTNKGELWDY